MSAIDEYMSPEGSEEDGDEPPATQPLLPARSFDPSEYLVENFVQIVSHSY